MSSKRVFQLRSQVTFRGYCNILKERVCPLFTDDLHIFKLCNCTPRCDLGSFLVFASATGAMLNAPTTAEKQNSGASRYLIGSEGTYILDIQKDMILLCNDLFKRAASHLQGRTQKDEADRRKAHCNGVGRHQAPEKKGHEVGNWMGFILSPLASSPSSAERR